MRDAAGFLPAISTQNQWLILPEFWGSLWV
jgi:hypothetical protein